MMDEKHPEMMGMDNKRPAPMGPIGMDNKAGTMGMDNKMGTMGMDNKMGTMGMDNKMGTMGMDNKMGTMGMDNKMGTMGMDNKMGTMGMDNKMGMMGMENKGCIPQETVITNVKLANAYVPWQKLCTVNTPLDSLEDGTAFPELFSPFEGINR